MKVAAGAAVLVVGGTAMAAETGNLPVAAQEQAHGWFSALGVPPPESATPTSGPVPTAGAPAARPEPTVTPGALPSATTPGSAAPDAATAGGLCRAWQAAGSKPRGQSMKPASRRALADLAGGEAAITGFCTRQLAGFPAAPTTETPAPSATTSHPGKGIGNGPGNGRSGDAPHP